MTVSSKRPPLEVLKDMVATDDPKERIRIYENANRSPMDGLFGSSPFGLDLGNIFQGIKK